jgi:hypothetical protein
MLKEDVWLHLTRFEHEWGVIKGVLALTTISEGDAGKDRADGDCE